MNKEVKKVITELLAGSISPIEFISLYPVKNINEEYCIDLLREALSNADSEKVEVGLIVGNSANCFSNKSASLLCELLQQDWHYKHEDIAALLKEVGDQTTVDCLYKAAQFQFDYLDYDDTYQFARKCIKVLSFIGGSKALEKLNLLTNVPSPQICAYATKEIHRQNIK
jgi:radical SAM superfamily enzyme